MPTHLLAVVPIVTSLTILSALMTATLYPASLSNVAVVMPAIFSNSFKQ